MYRPLWTYEDLDENTLLKLKSHGFQTKKDIETNIEGAQKICENIQDVIFNENTKSAWKTGHEVLKKEKERLFVTTLSKYLDELLCGGIELGKLTEIYGNCGSGKTQLCLQLAINTTLPRVLGGLEAESLYIETSKSVFPSRLTEMINAYLDHVKRNLERMEKVKDNPSGNNSVALNANGNSSVALNANGNSSVALAEERVVLPKQLNLDRSMRTNQRISDPPKQSTTSKQIETIPKSPDLNGYIGDTCIGVPQHRNHLMDNVHDSKKQENNFTDLVKANRSDSNIIRPKRKRKDTETDFRRIEIKPESAVIVGEKNHTTSKEFKINMTRTDLDKIINQSKISKSNLNAFLQNKLNSSTSIESNRITQELVRSKIHVHYCSNYYETIALVLNVESVLKRKKNIIKLIVLDNITFLFHNEDDSNYLKRTKNVHFLLNMLSSLAVTYNIAIVLVNQLTTKYLNPNQLTGTDRKVVPALGETFAHRIQTRLLVQKFNLGLLSSLGNTTSDVVDDVDNLFMCLIDKMSVHNEKLNNKKHALFQINVQGIRDV